MDEEELEEFVREESLVGDEVIDTDYEFDAARFYDFTGAETDSDAREAERWFDSAGDSPPSPFIKQQGIPIGVVNMFANSKAVEDVNAKNRGAKSKCQDKTTVSSSSTLMKPTASHLAKQNQLKFVHSIRLQKKLGYIDDKSSQNSSITDDLATKRQKLEAGYTSKEAQLKHKNLLLHKVPKKLDSAATIARPKATIPREPDLQTAHRAERRRYNKANAESGEQAISTAYTLKTRVTNRKIIEAPFFLVTRRSKQQEAEFQETKQMPYRNSSENGNTEGKRSNSVNCLRQEKCNSVNNYFEALSSYKKILSGSTQFCFSQNFNQATTTATRGLNVSTDKRFQDKPPTNLFSKLCLTSKAQQKTKLRSKTPQPKEIINVARERPQRSSGKDFGLCGRSGLGQSLNYKCASLRNLATQTSIHDGHLACMLI